MALTLVLNVALLVALTVLYQWIVRRWREWTLARQAGSGLLFGAIAVVGMMTPFRPVPGIQYDGRSIIIAVAGLFGGPVVAAVSGVIAAAYRLWLGGAGAWVGVGVVAESALLGVGYHYLRKHWDGAIHLLPLYALALVVHTGMLGIQLLLPGHVGASIVGQIWIPVLVFYPLGMLLACRLMLDQEQRLADETALRELNESLERIVDERTEELRATNQQLSAAWEELAIINQRLMEAGDAKSQFLRAMSHELRTPLNSIIGFSDLMQRGLAGNVNDEQLKQLDMINRSGRRLLAIVNDILDLSRIEAHVEQVSIERFDVGALARDVVDSVTPDAAAKGVSMGVELPGGETILESDHRKLGQILLNLVANAVKFTDAGSVTVRVRTDIPGVIALEVADTGPGIPDELRDKIFVEFVQEDDRVEGTGLGLSISRSLAELLGGTITLDTRVGVGSTFRVLLPDI